MASPMVVACIGDSSTMSGYPKVLPDLLKEVKTVEGRGSWKVENFGMANATAIDEDAQPYAGGMRWQMALESKADVYVVMLGTMDAKQSCWNEARYTHQIRELVDSLKRQKTAERKSPRVLLCAPPPFYSVGKAQQIETVLNDLIPRKLLPQLAEELDVDFVDTFGALGAGDSGYRHLISWDGLMPDVEGHKVIAEVITKALKNEELQAELAPLRDSFATTSTDINPKRKPIGRYDTYGYTKWDYTRDPNCKLIFACEDFVSRRLNPGA